MRVMLAAVKDGATAVVYVDVAAQAYLYSFALEQTCFELFPPNLPRSTCLLIGRFPVFVLLPFGICFLDCPDLSEEQRGKMTTIMD